MSYGQLPSASNALAADARSLNNLKLQAGQNTPKAIKEAAKQFESLFMRELIKSMREATMKSGLMDSPGGDLGADLLDQQFAVQMSGQPGGLSELIAQQLSRQMSGAEPGDVEQTRPQATAPINARSRAESLAAYGAPAATPTTSQSNFVQRHSEAAAQVEKTSGLPSGFMLGQAGHETGWGRHEIKGRDGAQSFNLFGIKATAGWKGKVAEVVTTEYVDGVAKKMVAKFRAYDSYEDSFRDYARLITQSPRYAQVSQQTDSAHAYASGLQKAGYATDPQYASKLSRAINTTLRLQRDQA
jgi:flagellar protein FlgJ